MSQSLFSKSPLRGGNAGFPSAAIPVKGIDLAPYKDQSAKKSRSKFLSKMGVIASHNSNCRSSSNASSYESDYSVGTSGVSLTNQRDISPDKFEAVQAQCMDLIKHTTDNMAKLEFKKLYASIKKYCKYQLFIEWFHLPIIDEYNDFNTFENGWSYLHEAAKQGNLDITHFMLTETEVDPNMVARHSDKENSEESKSPNSTGKNK